MTATWAGNSTTFPAQPSCPLSPSFPHQGRVPHTPGFPAKLVGVDELPAAFLNESRTRGRCLVPRTGNPGSRSFFARCGITLLFPSDSRFIRRTQRSTWAESSAIGGYRDQSRRDG